FGKVTTLYNNAAPSRLIAEDDRSVHELPEAVFDRMWAVITRGTFLVCKHGIPELRRAGGGSVINTSTTDAVVGQPGYDAYAAAAARPRRPAATTAGSDAGGRGRRRRRDGGRSGHGGGQSPGMAGRDGVAGAAAACGAERRRRGTLARRDMWGDNPRAWPGET